MPVRFVHPSDEEAVEVTSACVRSHQQEEESEHLYEQVHRVSTSEILPEIFQVEFLQPPNVATQVMSPVEKQPRHNRGGKQPRHSRGRGGRGGGGFRFPLQMMMMMTLINPPPDVNQQELQQQLEMLLNDQRQTTHGRRIIGITTTNTFTTAYKDGGRHRVTRNLTIVRA